MWLAVTGSGALAGPPHSVSDSEDVLVAYELMDGLTERTDPTWTRPKPRLVT